jgi:hypothetical protein
MENLHLFERRYVPSRKNISPNAIVVQKIDKEGMISSMYDI